MKHNLSITLDQKLFREIENTRGREKRSTFIEYLLVVGLREYVNKKEKGAADDVSARLVVLSSSRFNRKVVQG